MELDIDFSGITINDTNTANKVALDASSVILTGDAKVGIGTNNPQTLLHIKKPHPAITSLTKVDDFYMQIGDREYSYDSYRLIGFGYIYDDDSMPPAYIGYEETDQTGDTKGNLIFATRNDTGQTTEPTKRMCITSGGNVGIGTTTPSYPLHVKGVYTTNTQSQVGMVGRVTAWDANQHPSWTAEYIGIKVEGSIWVDDADTGIPYSYYLNSSDRRIKTDISLIDDSTALDKVNQLESHEYNYIAMKKPIKTIGFIAQEVKDVVPNAVLLQTAFIPDELRKIENPQWSQFTDLSGNTKFKLEINNIDFSGNFTGKCKFYVSNDPSGNDEVCKEVKVENDNKIFIFDESWNNVLLYGKEVTDFHTLDKNQIFALHHSAIQELSRKHDAVVEENKKLKDENDDFKKRLETLEQAFINFQNNN